MEDKFYMQRALTIAKLGAGFVNPNPMVGAVIVKNGKIIGEGYHEKFGELHAERNALKNCTESPKGATMYVTLEPCQMCAGACIQARIPRVVIGCLSPKSGSCGTVATILGNEAFMHTCEIETGVLADECSAVLKEFFIRMRAEKKALDQAYK